MSDVFGLSEKGFKAKDFSTIKDELEKTMLAQIDPTLRFGPDTVAGILTAIVAHQARQVWETASGLYHSLQANSATGQALDALCGLTGTFRKKAEYSRAKIIVTLAGKTTLPKDSRIQSLGGHFFRTSAELKNEGSAVSDIETDTIALETGPIVAHPATEAKIMTPIAGWSKTVIKDTYEIGRHEETDDELRVRRIDELRANGSSTRDALYARLKLLPQVEAVYIKEDAHSFEVIIKGGKDEEIAHTIWQGKPLGIETSGKVLMGTTDSTGQERSIWFSRPEVIDFKLAASLAVKALLEPQKIKLIKNALLDFSSKSFKLGTEVYPSKFYAVLLAHPSILDIKSLTLTECSPAIPPRTSIAPHQVAALSLDNISIQQTLGSNE